MGNELRIKDIMQKEPISVEERYLATKARSLFRRHGYRSLPVLSKTGRLSDAELIRIGDRIDILKVFMKY